MTALTFGAAHAPAPAAGGDDVSRSRAQVARLIALLDEKAPALEAQADENERLGKLNERTLQLLREAEIPTLFVPVEMGGLGMYPGDALRVIERLATIDAVVGWIGGNWSSAGFFLSYLDPQLAGDMLEDGAPLLGQSGAPSGKALPVEGGYRVTGAWQFGSGDLQADYIFVSAIVTDADGQPQMVGPMPRILTFGVTGDQIEDRGNWDVLGLRATGSVDFAITDVFVPDSMVVNPFLPAPRATKANAGGISVLLPYLHDGFALGAGRRLLDEIARFAQRPSSRGGSLAETPLFRADLAHHEAAFRAARALVHESFADVDARLAAGDPLSRRDATLLKMALIHVHDVVRDIAVFAFNRGSGTSLRAGLLQRWVRDTLSGCQHLIVQHAGLHDVGWELMGAPADMVWSPVGLVKMPS